MIPIPSPVIQTKGLRKSYGKFEAVRGVDLCVEPNRITGFLGANGAGKSSTIKMLLGMAKVSGGSGSVLGRDIADPKANVDMRRHVAYVSEDKRLYSYMTVDQIIRFTRACYDDWDLDMERALLRDYELPPDRKIKSLSKGMRTKVALLLALARRPELLILDEPSDGLDPCGVEQLLESLVTQSGNGTSIFFSSHQIPEVERIADNVCILDKGKLILDTSMDDLRVSYRQITLVFPEAPAEREFQLAGVELIRTKGLQMAVFASGNADAVVERARSFRATSIDVAPVALRDIYLTAVRGNSNALV
jgi:ABC-2 type transport system ATP-binding protein